MDGELPTAPLGRTGRGALPVAQRFSLSRMGPFLFSAGEGETERAEKRIRKATPPTRRLRLFLACPPLAMARRRRVALLSLVLPPGGAFSALLSPARLGSSPSPPSNNGPAFK